MLLDLIQRLSISHRARTEARLGVDGRTRRLKETLGENPLQLSEGSLQRREAVQALGDRGPLKDAEADLEQLETAQTTIGTPLLYTAALIFLGLCETAGALRLLQGMNVSADQRALPAIALALTLMVLTKAAADLTTPKRVTAAAAAAGGTPPPSWRSFVVPIVYSLFIGAIAAMRMASQGEDEEGTDLFSFADAAITVAITAGPAWLAALVAKKRAIAVEFANRVGLVRRRVRDLRRRETDARRYLRDLDARDAAHRNALTRADAAYSLAHDVARAEQESSADQTSS